ncbi:uncharacterized protein LOC103482843 isoform X2 [Cucumis melo]|nr:uncharacterized protein LOC103482843 isoform X2 [Cucumis melo]XP_050945875.1 uncharacterized protein LOC103482843 isoform X2 [Cucumis melo]XP_050945876.1 uncharacterized protein LOC103482843 isoform X2 [Cucumis melo]
MDDTSTRIKFIPDHFQVSPSNSDCSENSTPSSSTEHPRVNDSSRSHDHSWTRRKLRSASFMLNLLSLRRLSWGSGSDGQEKVVLSAVELATLRSEIADLEEREAHLKAQLEHIDELLRSARLSGYLYIRTRWEALPGEPPPIDDTDVDDWLPRFVVLHGKCIYFYLSSTDISPQDSTLLADIVEVGSLPSITREDEDEDVRYAFYISTRQGLRYECSSISKIQVDSWLLALQSDCKIGCGNETSSSNNGSISLK